MSFLTKFTFMLDLVLSINYYINIYKYLATKKCALLAISISEKLSIGFVRPNFRVRRNNNTD